jgi:hypothetical protein
MLMFTGSVVLFHTTQVLDFTVKMSFKHVHCAWSGSKAILKQVNGIPMFIHPEELLGVIPQPYSASSISLTGVCYPWNLRI